MASRAEKQWLSGVGKDEESEVQTPINEHYEQRDHEALSTSPGVLVTTRCG
jgi:hypothetical protein